MPIENILRSYNIRWVLERSEMTFVQYTTSESLIHRIGSSFWFSVQLFSDLPIGCLI